MNSPNPPLSFRGNGFSLVEALIVVAVLGIIATLSTGLVGNFNRSVIQEKLHHDVKTINSAISVYQAMGGKLDESDEPQQILEKLKSVVTDDLVSRMPGVSGAVIDSRIRAVTSDETPDNAFAEWNPAKKKFEVVTDGNSAQSLKILKFELGEESETVTTETRDPSMKYAASSTWIWDYEDRPIPAPPGPTVVMVSLVPDSAPPGPISLPSPPSSPVTLDPPLYSIPGGDFPMTDFPMSLTLTNPNPGGSSEIIFWINGGSSAVYTGGTINLTANSTVSAYAKSLNNAAWTDSGTGSQSYNRVITPPEITFTMTVTFSNP